MPPYHATLSQASLIVAASSVGAAAGAGARTEEGGVGGEEDGSVTVGGFELTSSSGSAAMALTVSSWVGSPQPSILLLAVKVTYRNDAVRYPPEESRPR